MTRTQFALAMFSLLLLCWALIFLDAGTLGVEDSARHMDQRMQQIEPEYRYTTASHSRVAEATDGELDR